jgi:hypothetical protein
MATTASRAETAILRFALVAAVLLVFAPFGSRTTWTDRTGAEIRDAAGWDWIAALAGAAAIAALAGDRLTRLRVPCASFCAAVAAGAFGVATFAAGSYWAAIERGSLQPQMFTLDLAVYAVRPAPGPPYFTAIAAIGVACAMLLALRWLRPAVALR